MLHLPANYQLIAWLFTNYLLSIHIYIWHQVTKKHLLIPKSYNNNNNINNSNNKNAPTFKPIFFLQCIHHLK